MNRLRSGSSSRLLLVASASIVAVAAFGCVDAPRGADVVVVVPPAPRVAAVAAAPTNPLKEEIAADLELSARERRDWDADLAAYPSPCPELAVSLARCVDTPSACAACRPAARFVAEQIHHGRSKADRDSAFRARFDPGAIKSIPDGGVASRGPAGAPVTIVIWADLECPFCKLVSPLIDDVQRRFPADVRVVYRLYPLQHHPHAEAASRAAIAAGKQGKFWEMRDLIYADQDHLEPADLEAEAARLHLDVHRLKADAASPATSALLAADVDAADAIGLDGTPFIFVNGRKLDLLLFDDPLTDIDRWVQTEIELSKKSVKPAPLVTAR